MANIEILPFSESYYGQVTALFVKKYHQQRLAIPLLPERMADRDVLKTMLADSFDATTGLVAVENSQVLGYLCWFIVDHFRATSRRGAYVPEWGHACIETDKTKLYQMLYRAAGNLWAQAGCQVHAITLLEQDRSAEKAWYWNGFGLTVVDAIRPMQPLEISHQTQLTIRKASTADAKALAQLDKEHREHYTQSPIFMAPRTGKDVNENIEFLSQPKNSVWLAESDNQLVGFIRFEGYDFDTATILESEEGITITGAYVRPAYRGQKVAVTLLDSALRDYQSMGLKYCATNFESFNPEAVSFWMRYFEPVCYSVIRVPEA
jgi:GNAT superfamily N-acetyltransferase